MKFTTITTLVYPLLSILSLAVVAAPLEPRDVYSPPILYPTSDTVWKVGDCYDVTWNVTNPPKQITNPHGEIHLVYNGIIDLQNFLAKDFDILLGKITIKVPQVPDGIYQILLMGDSGNDSPPFTIKNN